MTIKYKIGRSYHTLDGHTAKVIGKLSDGRLIIQVADHVVISEPDGKSRPRMICNYVSDGPSAYDLTEEEL